MDVRHGVWIAVSVLVLNGCALSQNSVLDRSPSLRDPTVDSARCPATSTPDRPAVALIHPRVGHDGWTLLPAAMDDSAHAVVVLDGTGQTWTFDVCRNRWQRKAAVLTATGPGARLVHVASEDETLALDVSFGDRREVWSYSLPADAWTPVAGLPANLGIVTDAAYDPDRDLVWAWDDGNRSLWSFDPSKRSWVPVDNPVDVPLPNAHSWDTDDRWPTLMTYDTSRHVLLLAFAGIDVSPGSTWTFDPGSSTWDRVADEGPRLTFGWFETGNEVTFDSDHAVTVATASGRVATYGAGEEAWTYSSTAGDEAVVDPYVLLGSGPVSRQSHSVVFDGVNGRVILLGGQTVAAESVPENSPAAGGPYAPAAVWAYDVGTGGWTLLSSPPD